MKILRVSAENFRTLKNVEVKFLADYCTISGKNNAGKSAVVKIIEHFLEDDDGKYYRDERGIRFDRDSTQWEKGKIVLELEIVLSKEDDTELFYFIDRFSAIKLSGERVNVRLRSEIDTTSAIDIVIVDGERLEHQGAAEVLKKFKSTSTIVIHNSTRPKRQYFYHGDELVEFIESQFSDDDNKKIVDAQSVLHAKVRAAAKKHKQDLTEYLGRLKERYEIELVPPERGHAERVPLTVRLGDKSVDVPLNEWGTGTQNRTRALISVFGAARTRRSAAPTDRVTPVVIIEEPESFLHPSAQAEFGKVLNQLASETEIQIIATTHSPYMLNQTKPDANILLDRKVYRNMLRETLVVEASGDNWMKPFSENLGLIPEDFSALQDLFKKDAPCVVLVEGAIDKDYLDHLRAKYPSICTLPDRVEVVSYGGKDTLKNTALIKFIIARFDRVFVTFDLDAERDCKTALERLGLVHGQDFCAVGLNKPGQDCIEGLAPDSIKSSVFAENPDLIMALSSDADSRKKAKETLKSKILAEFKRADLNEADLKEFKSLFKRMAKTFS